MPEAVHRAAALQVVALQVAELRAAVRPVAVKLAVAVGAADRQVACPTRGAVPLAGVRAASRLPVVPAVVPREEDLQGAVVVVAV